MNKFIRTHAGVLNCAHVVSVIKENNATSGFALFDTNNTKHRVSHVPNEILAFLCDEKLTDLKKVDTLESEYAERNRFIDAKFAGLRKVEADLLEREEQVQKKQRLISEAEAEIAAIEKGS